jgi:outer membrane receptor for ferric coprogen and ferric-rhodotorulic acid
VKLSEPLTAIVGGRASEWEFRQRNVRSGAVASTYDDTAFTPYGGLVYDLNSTWSAYVSYAEIFQVQNSFEYDGDRLEPIVGATYEVGLKGELYDGRLNTSLALFRAIRDNVAQPDPVHSGPAQCNGQACYIAAGEQQSEGLELEVSGMLRPRWNLFAGYTYNTNEYVRDRTVTGAPSANQGQPLMSYTPEHIFRLWTNYALPGTAERFSIGGGVTAQTRFYRILNAGTVNMTQPGYELWSARLGYRISDSWSAALNGNNLLDEKYYSRMNLVDQGSVYGEPRNYMLSLQGRF